ncbi:hypothetical protein [Xylella fastidiosa]|nr:hypothetical protein [Xylella fastidiosa]
MPTHITDRTPEPNIRQNPTNAPPTTPPSPYTTDSPPIQHHT